MRAKAKQYIYFTILVLATVLNLAAIEPTLDSLHIVTFTPQPGDQTPDAGRKDSFESIATALKNGKRSELNGINAQIPNKNVVLSCSLPENHTGTIYLNVPPLIGSHDKHGYPERGAYEMYGLFKSGVIEQGIGVSYCPPNHKRNEFNFGKEQDQRTISMLINEIAKRNPQAKIVPMGICSGATGIINTLASDKLSPQAQQSIDAVVLQSPAISSDKVWHDMGDNLFPYGLKWFLPVVVPWYFPKCTASKPQEDVLASYKNIPPHIGFMIGKLAQDPVTPAPSIKEVEKALTVHNHSVAVFETNDTKIKHGFLAPNKEYQTRIKQFLIQRKLDHAVATDTQVADERPLGVSLWFL